MEMEKLMEIMETEVVIEFKPMAKCRTELHVRCLHPTEPIAFKVQSTSPSRFHVTPPAGILPPLAITVLRVTLRPQTHLPPPTDRFLIRASLDPRTHDTKLRVSYVDPASRLPETQTGMPALDGDFSYFNPLFAPGATSPMSSSSSSSHQKVVKRETAEMPEEHQMALLLTAARRGDLTQLETLLKNRGARIHGHDQYNTTALHCAAVKGHREAVSLLVAFGVDVECEDVEGHTPLHLAVEGGSVETAEMLINLGADVNAKSKRGATPLYIARSMGYEVMVRLLIRRGASTSSSSSSSEESSSSSSASRS